MFTFFEIGGKIRDELLGLPSKDIDYVAVPNIEKFDKSSDIVSIFEALVSYLNIQRYDIFLLTQECYTIRARFPKGHENEGVVADFVLARKEIGYKEGTREPIVVPGTLYDDMQRRDFTVNAMAKNPATGAIIDYFGGTTDLKNKVLRTPIDGRVTFADDPLRLLRAVRFAVTKGFTIGEEINEVLHRFDYKNKFAVVSTERIREELHKAFKVNTNMTLYYLNKYYNLSDYIFTKTNLWLKPTTEL
jgi:poly(A) polymerase